MELSHDLIEQIQRSIQIVFPKIRRISTIKCLDGGSKHNNILLGVIFESGMIEEFVIRRPQKNSRFERSNLYKEHRLLKLLEYSGFKQSPSSLVFCCSPLFQLSPFTVQKYIIGQKISDPDGDLIGQLAILLGRLHSIEIDTFLISNLPILNSLYECAQATLNDLWQQQESIVRFLSSKRNLRNKKLLDIVYKNLSAKVMDFFVTQPWQNSHHTVLIHGDFGLHNLLSTKDGLYLLDWEYSTMGDPAYDLAFLIHTGEWNDEMRSILFFNYKKVGPIWDSKDLYQRVLLYESIAAYQDVLWALDQYYISAPISKRADKAKWYEAFIRKNLFVLDTKLSSNFVFEIE